MQILRIFTVVYIHRGRYAYIRNAFAKVLDRDCVARPPEPCQKNTSCSPERDPNTESMGPAPPRRMPPKSEQHQLFAIKGKQNEAAVLKPE
eukprot:53608-Prymnesium_polylepis.1